MIHGTLTYPPSTEDLHMALERGRRERSLALLAWLRTMLALRRQQQRSSHGCDASTSWAEGEPGLT